MDILFYQYKVLIFVVSAVCSSSFVMIMYIANYKRLPCNSTFTLLGTI